MKCTCQTHRSMFDFDLDNKKIQKTSVPSVDDGKLFRFCKQHFRVTYQLKINGQTKKQIEPFVKIVEFIKGIFCEQVLLHLNILKQMGLSTKNYIYCTKLFMSETHFDLEMHLWHVKLRVYSCQYFTSPVWHLFFPYQIFARRARVFMVFPLEETNQLNYPYKIMRILFFQKEPKFLFSSYIYQIFQTS